MKKLNLISKFAFALLLLSVACSEDDPDKVEPSSYTWSPVSTFASTPDFISILLVDENQLYAFGSDWNGVRGIFKLDGNEWEMYREISLDNLISNNIQFAIINDIVYLSSFNELYKVQGSSIEKILTATSYFNGVCEFQGKLIVTGEGITVSNAAYTIVSYNGSAFTGLSSQYVTGRIFEANGKLFLPGYPGFEYDGVTLESNDLYGYFYAVDNEESLYYYQSETNQTGIFKRSKKKDLIQIGESISGYLSFYGLDFFDDTVIGVANESQQSFSATYFLKDNTWIKIPTIVNISNLTVYKDRLFATTDGALIELIRD